MRPLPAWRRLSAWRRHPAWTRAAAGSNVRHDVGHAALAGAVPQVDDARARRREPRQLAREELVVGGDDRDVGAAQRGLELPVADGAAVLAGRGQRRAEVGLADAYLARDL